jgi:hypothetical protein
MLGTPITLLHELGHALTALALGVSRAIVNVGRPPGRAWSLGRLELRARLLNSPRWAWFGTIDVPDELTRTRAIVVLAAGPVVTAAVLASILVAAALVPWPPVILVWAVAAAVAWQLS